MNAPQTAPATTTTATATTPAFDIDAALEEATRAMYRVGAKGKDSREMTEAERRSTLASICSALGLNPLTNPVRFLALSGGETLYVTRQATDQIAARLRLNRETLVGPEVRDLCGTKLAFCQVRVTAPDGRSEVATATLPFTDPANVLMKVETKAKRRAVLSLVGLGLLTEEDAEAALAAESDPGNGAPPSNDPVGEWRNDLRTVGRMRELRVVYNAHANALRIAGIGGRDDVRAWLRARGLCAIDTETTAIIATVPEALLAALDLAALVPNADVPEPKPDVDALVRAARKARGETADPHSTKTVWTILARSYGVARDLSLRDAAAALKEICEQPDGDGSGDDEPPPNGTDGRGKGSAEEGSDAASAAAYEAHVAARGEQANADWRASAAGITAHVATLGPKHLENSGRTHLRAIRASLREHALNAYADRLRALSQRTERDEEGNAVVTEMPARECFARVEGWLREGPRVAAIAPQRREDQAA